MLNRAARFFPILRELKPYLTNDSRVLEIGSGARGLGEYYPRMFVGCDILFREKPRTPLIPVVASATALPFADMSFDSVVLSDVMEHVPPEMRRTVIRESLRVARRVVVVGYPCGLAAHLCDRKLYEEYERREMEIPIWLEEHMQAPYPERELFDGIDDWTVKQIPNESLDFHFWMMKREMSRLWSIGFRAALLIVPTLVARWLKSKDKEPSYRQIFVLSRNDRGHV